MVSPTAYSISKKSRQYKTGSRPSQGCVKVARNVTFPGRHGDLPLRELVGATLCSEILAWHVVLIQKASFPYLNPGYAGNVLYYL